MNTRVVIPIALVFSFLFNPIVFAISSTPSATPKATSVETSVTSQKLDDLKERLATKVAQLQQSERKAFFGSVKSKSVTSLTIETKTKDIKIELTDDIKIAQFIKGKRVSLTVDDVDKGDIVTVFGEYDSTIDLLKAKGIFIQNTLPRRVSGTISAIDTTDFTVSIISDNQTYIIDIEKDTRINSWTKEKGIVKTGFSKLAIGDTVHIVGTSVLKKENRISALRIVSIGNLPAGKAGLTGTTPTPMDTEASAAATPTKKISPTPTKKVIATPTP